MFNKLKKIGACLGILIVILTPTWLYLVMSYMFDHDNAIVQVLLLGIAIYFMGMLQIVLLIIGSMIIHTVYMEK